MLVMTWHYHVWLMAHEVMSHDMALPRDHVWLMADIGIHISASQHSLLNTNNNTHTQQPIKHGAASSYSLDACVKCSSLPYLAPRAPPHHHTIMHYLLAALPLVSIGVFTWALLLPWRPPGCSPHWSLLLPW